MKLSDSRFTDTEPKTTFGYNRNTSRHRTISMETRIRSTLLYYLCTGFLFLLYFIHSYTRFQPVFY